MTSVPSLTVDEKISLVLIHHMRFLEEFEVPPALTQEGLASLTGTARPNIARTLKRMGQKGRTTQRLAHIRGHRRRKKVYFLSNMGFEAAQKLSRGLGSLEISTENGKEELGDLAERLEMSLIEAYMSLDNDLYFKRTSSIKDPPGSTEDGFSPPGGAQLPYSVPGEFLGRNVELKRLKDWLARDSSSFMVIHGMAGIGKTTLIGHFCASLKGRKVIWHRSTPGSSRAGEIHNIQISIKRAGMNCPALDEVTTVADLNIIDPFDVASSLAADLDSCERHLLVLDDLHRASEGFLDVMRSLVDIAPPTTRIVVTSRRKGGFYSRRDVMVSGKIVELQLTGIDRDHSLSMLGSRGFSSEEAAAIWARTEGHPIALDLASLGGPDGVAGCTALDEDVEGFFREEVLSRVKGERLDALRFISIFRSPLPVGSAVIRDAGIDPSALDHLVERSLLSKSSMGFEVHSLIRSVASSRITGEVWKRYHALAAEHYLRDRSDLGSVIEAVYHLTACGDGKRLVDILRSSGMMAYREGFLEMVMLLDGFRWEGGDSADRAWFLYMMGHGKALIGLYEDAGRSLEEGITIYRKLKLKDDRLLLGIKESMGGVLSAVNDHVSARRSFREAYDIFRKMAGPGDEDNIRAVGALNGLGRSYRSTNEPEQARKWFLKGVELSGDSGLDDMYCTALFDLGCTLLELEEIEKARERLEEGLELAVESGDGRLEASFLDRLGYLEAGDGNLDGGLELYEKALTRSISSSGIRETAGHFMDIAERYRISRMNRPLAERVISFLKRGRGDEMREIARFYDRICSIQRRRGSFGTEEFHRRAVGMFKGLDLRKQEAKAGNNLAFVLKRAGREEDALGTYLEALMVSKRVGDPKGQAITHFNIGVVLKKMGRDKGAREHLQQAGSLFKKESMERQRKMAKSELDDIG